MIILGNKIYSNCIFNSISDVVSKPPVDDGGGIGIPGNDTELTENVISTLDLYSNKIPSLFIRNFVSKVNKGATLGIYYYVSDSDQSEYLYDVTNKKFTTVVELNGKVFKKTTYAGEQVINLGTMDTVGDYTYCIYCIDETGVTSFKQYFDFKVIAPVTYNTYNMTANDLNKYSIVQGTVSTSVAQANKAGLTNLFKAVKNNGYNKIVMLGGTYYIDYHGNDITFPSDFTVDMNGSTIAVTQCTDLNKGYMINLKDCIDTHVTNGIVKGNYKGFDFQTTANNTGYYIPGEGLSCLDIEGSSYCTFTDMDVSGSVGYNLGVFNNGIDLFGQNKDELKFTSTGYIDREGNLVSKSGLATSGFVDISQAQKYGEFQVSRLLGYAGCFGDIAEIYVHFYDASRNYLYSIKSRQYQRIKLTKGNEYHVKITAFGTTDALTDKMCVHYLKTSRNCEIKGLTVHDTRTCCMHPGIYENILIENCNMINVAAEDTWKVTKLALDFEDGYENGKNLFFINNSVSDGANNLTIQSCYNANIVKNRGYVMDFRSKMKGGFIKNNFFTTGMFYVGEHINQSHVKFINNTFDRLNVTAYEQRDTNLPIRFLDGNSWEGNMVINMGAKVIGVNYTPTQGGEPDPIVYYAVTNNLSNCTTSNTLTSIESGSSFYATISAVDGYTLGKVTCTMGGSSIAVSGGSIAISKVTGNIVISCTAVKTEEPVVYYTVTNNLSNCTTSNSTSSIRSGNSFYTTISPIDGYELGKVTCTMGGSTVYVSGGSISIYSVTGNIIINCTATKIEQQQEQIILSPVTGTTMSLTTGNNFTLTYRTNIIATKHEVSYNGGQSYWQIYPTNSGSTYTYSNENVLGDDSVGTITRTIRVTDANGSTSTCTWTITVTKSSSSETNPGGGNDQPSTGSGINGTQVLAQQYASSHDGYCHGIPTDAYGGFYYKPRINPDGPFPNSDWNATLMWLTSYLENGASYYDNVGVRLENPKIYMFDFSKNKWVLFDDTFNWGTWYREDFWNDGNGDIAGTVRFDSNKKGVTILQNSSTSGRCYHAFTNQKNWRNSGISHNNTPYIITSVDFKLVKYNESGANNLNNAKILVNAGADWWSYVGANWNSDWTSNRDMSVGKYIRATTTMQTAYCTNIPQNWSYGFDVE